MSNSLSMPVKLFDVLFDDVPVITLDKQRRFCLNAAARRLLDIKPYDCVSLAYNPKDHALAIVKSEATTAASAERSRYYIDRRYSMSAGKFVIRYAYAVKDGPYRFVYDRSSSDDGVFIFRL